MKKNYTSPKIKLIKVNTENVMAGMSAGMSVETGKWDGSNGNHGIDGSTGTYDGSQPETAKDNGGNNLWDNEN